MDKENTTHQELATFYQRQLHIYQNAISSLRYDPNYPRIMQKMETYIQGCYSAIEKIAPGCVKSPGASIVQALRGKFPIKSKIELDVMEGPHAPPAGTTGTVVGVDDLGSILVKWDATAGPVDGASKKIGYGRDKCHRLYAVKRVDGVAIPLCDRFPSGSRVRLDRDVADVYPSGITGTVKYVDEDGNIDVKWDGYSHARLIPGEDKFHRIWDIEKDPKAIARELLSFCQDNHYRQSPAIIGYWQPGVLSEQTIECLYSVEGMTRIIQGICQFRDNAKLPTKESSRADKLLQTLYARYSYIYPAIRMSKDRIADFVQKECGEKIKVDFSDLRAIPIASTQQPNGPMVQVYVNLIDLNICTFANGKLVKSLQFASMMEFFITGLHSLDLHALTDLSEEKEVDAG